MNVGETLPKPRSYPEAPASKQQRSDMAFSGCPVWWRLRRQRRHCTFVLAQSTKTWMGGQTPPMTKERDPRLTRFLFFQQALSALHVPEHRDAVQHAGQIGTIR